MDASEHVALWVDQVVSDDERTALTAGVAFLRAMHLAGDRWSLSDDAGGEYELLPGELKGLDFVEGVRGEGLLVFDGAVPSDATELTLRYSPAGMDPVELALPVGEHDDAKSLSDDELVDLPAASVWEAGELPRTQLTASEPLTSEELEVRDILAGLDAEVVDDGVMVTFPNDVLFEFDEADLSGQGRDLIADMAQAITHYAGDDVFVYGHTDAVGDPDYNQDLSERRAQAVASELVEAHDVEQGRITAEGFGETQPVAPNETADGADNPDGRALNRRVEVLIATDDERLVDVDSADAQASGEAGGLSVEVTGVAVGVLSVELDVVARNEAEEVRRLVGDAATIAAPRLVDDAGFDEYLFSYSYDPEHPVGGREDHIDVEPGTEVDTTLVWFGRPPADAEHLEVALNPDTDSAMAPTLSLDDIPVPDADGDGGPATAASPEASNEGPETSDGDTDDNRMGTRYGADARRAARVDAQGVDTTHGVAVLRVTGVRGYDDHTAVDVAIAVPRFGVTADASLNRGRERGVSLRDDLGNAYWLQPPEGNDHLTLERARLHTGTLVFGGRLSPEASNLILTVNDGYSTELTSLPDIEVHFELPPE